MEFARIEFPKAPERLAERLGVEVRYDDLSCDGWCIRGPKKTIIHLNKSVAKSRQKFTLAHELGHIVLDIPSIIGESAMEVRKALNNEEEAVNAFAADLLLPAEISKTKIREIPVSSKRIKRFAKEAKTSEVFIIRRLATLAEDLGLESASALFFNKDAFAWQWPDAAAVKFNSEEASLVLGECERHYPNPSRFRMENGDVVTASLLSNPTYDVNTIFVQVTVKSKGAKLLDEEIERELKSQIFKEYPEYEAVMAGCLGFLKRTIISMSSEDALAEFNRRYLQKTPKFSESFTDMLLSDKGQQYVLVRLKSLQEN